MGLEFQSEISSGLSRCLGCGGCNIPCPMFNAEGRVESFGMRSRIKLMWMLSKGSIELTESILRHIFTCANCGLCSNYCPVSLKPFELIVRTRGSLIDMGYVPLVTVDIRDSFRRSGSPISDDLIKGNWLPPDFQPTKSPDLLLFAGCWMHKATEVALNVIKIMEKASESFTTLGPSEPCSGALLHVLGEVDLAQESKEKLVSSISELNPKEVISGCALTTRVYRDLNFTDLTTFILNSLKSGKLKLSKHKGKEITILPIPSCGSNGSLLGLLGGLEGIKVLEPPEWLCCDCGFTLIFRMERERFLNWIQAVISVAEKLGANRIVVEDVGCYAMLTEAMEAKSRIKGVKISHLSGFIMEYLK